MTTTLLSSKQQRLPRSAQIQALVRIGRRALAQSDYLRRLAADYRRNAADPSFWVDEPDGPERALAWAADYEADAVKAFAKAQAATAEIERLSALTV